MTLAVKHRFVSAKGDPADTTLVRPSNWNDTHAITLAADVIVGRDSTGAGDAQELACTALARAFLAAGTADTMLASLGIGGFSTGDVKFTLKNAADPGWLLMNDGTIGPTGSTANTYANDACQALYTLLWNNIANAYAPVTGGRGGTAALDWAAKKPIAMTRVMGRALAAAGSGQGLTARTLGSYAGEENHTLTTAEIPSGVISNITTAVADTRIFAAHGVNGSTGGNASDCFLNASTDVPTSAHPLTVISGSIGASNSWVDNGANAAHNNVQPTTYLNVMVKL